MIIAGKCIITLCAILIIVLTAGSLKGKQLDLPKLDSLQVSFLRGNFEEKGYQCRNEIASIFEEECSFCHNKEVTDFTKNGNRAKKDMKASIAIGVKCDYCHAGKGRYTEIILLAKKMFKLTEMMDVECNFCHAGKDMLTHRGWTARAAMILQKWTKKGNTKCLECHIEKKHFELNANGMEYLKSLMDK